MANQAILNLLRMLGHDLTTVRAVETVPSRSSGEHPLFLVYKQYGGSALYLLAYEVHARGVETEYALRSVARCNLAVVN